MESAPCWIYKNLRRDGMYLFVPGEEAFDDVPADLLAHFSERQFIMSLQLSEDRRLARVDASKVLQQLDEQGYYLQMPPSDAEPTSGEQELTP